MTLCLWPSIARGAIIATLVAFTITIERLLTEALDDDVIAIILILIVAVIGIAWVIPVVIKPGASR